MKIHNTNLASSVHVVCWLAPDMSDSASLHCHSWHHSALSLDSTYHHFHCPFSSWSATCNRTTTQSMAKTEFLLIGTKQQRLKFSNLNKLDLSGAPQIDVIPVSSSARNLGFNPLTTDTVLRLINILRSAIQICVISTSETSVEFVKI